jgi:ferritin-like protein
VHAISGAAPMPTITDDDIWRIADTAKEVVQTKAEWIRYSARTAAEVAVDVVADFTNEELTKEERELLMRNAIEMATQRLSDLVGDLAEDLADKHL